MVTVDAGGSVHEEGFAVCINCGHDHYDDHSGWYDPCYDCWNTYDHECPAVVAIWEVRRTYPDVDAE